MLHLLIDILRNSILITGLVVVMMMMIESLNIESKGLFFKGLRKTKTGQVITGALLGSIPGCMGGFATVSLYTHKMLSFGALVAMMIASSGDEAFMMLAMIPQQALILFVILFILAIIVGIITDKIYDKRHAENCHKHNHENCGVETDCNGYEIHHQCAHDNEEMNEQDSSATKRHSHKRHYGVKRISMFIGLALFITALATGNLGHDHSAHEGHDHANQENCSVETDCNGFETHHQCGHDNEGVEKSINLLSEDWMNVLFAGLSVIMLFVLIFASDHFVEGHLWNHIIKKHLPTIFAWTFGVLLVLGILMHYIDINDWISNNTALMVLLATLIGIIPESGPHLIFVTLFATGVVSFPVLLASSISQDGHASIPLLAESKKSFLWAKIINCAVALLAGFTAMMLM